MLTLPGFERLHCRSFPVLGEGVLVSIPWQVRAPRCGAGASPCPPVIVFFTLVTRFPTLTAVWRRGRVPTENRIRIGRAAAPYERAVHHDPLRDEHSNGVE